MRWLVLVYSILCFLLFLVSFLFLNGFFYEGMPPGTYLNSVDVSSMNFKSFSFLANKSVNKAKSYIFKCKIENRTIYLEHNRNIFFSVKKKELLKQYRLAKNRVSFVQRLKSFIYLDYKRYDIPLNSKIDYKRSAALLKKKLKSFEGEIIRIEDNQLIRSQKIIDYKELFSKIEKTLEKKPPNMYSVPISFVKTSTEEIIEQDKLFLISEASTPLLSSDRAYDLISDLIPLEDSVLLNPGDLFSFKSYINDKSLDLSFYEDKYLYFEDYIYNDFYGLELLSSTILQVSIAANLKIKELHYQKNILPKADVVRNTYSSDLSKEFDLKLYQNKREPLRLIIRKNEESISVGIYSYIPPKETYSLKLDFYKSLYPKIEVQEDLFLGKEVIKIIKKPLNGLMSQFKRQIFKQGVQVSYHRLKKRKILARDGMILVGKNIHNVYDPKILYILGLQELNKNQ
ncbi:MAG: hypothetical protein COB02_11240 [Candidatus Cloacimonadota bacterium]|nr:MAG: hypothetical protein COB02_11240 [Candidatus Cloacimonadota bacterium]